MADEFGGIPVKAQAKRDEFGGVLIAASSVPGMEKLGGAAPPAPKMPGIGAGRDARQIPAEMDPNYTAPSTFQNPRTGRIGTNRAQGNADPLTNFIDAPISGVPKMAEGVEQMSNPYPKPGNTPGTMQPPTAAQQITGGASKVIRGAMQTAAPLLPGAIAAAPIAVATGVTTGTVAGKAAHAGLKAMGAPDEVADLGEDITGLYAGGKIGGAIGRSKSASRLTEKISEKMDTDPHKQLSQALRPANTNFNFEQNLQEAKPLLAAAQSTAGEPAAPKPSNTTPATGVKRPTARPIESLDDLITAAKVAKTKIRAQFDGMKPEGVKVSGDQVADRILSTISSRMEQTDPSQVQAVRQFAESYRGKQLTLDQLEDHLTEANAELNGFYRRSPHGQQVSSTANLNTASVKAEAEALREALYTGMDQYGDGTVSRQLKHQYGSIIDVLTAAQNRKNVALRQVPVGLADQAANLAASGESLSAISAVLSGHPLVAAGVAGNAAARKAMAVWIKDANSTDGLIRRAFEGTAKDEAWTRPKGLIGAGTIKMPPAPDTSGGGMQPLAPHQQVNRMYKALPVGTAPFTQGTIVPDVLGRPDLRVPYNAGLLEAPMGPQNGAPPSGPGPFIVGTPGMSPKQMPPDLYKGRGVEVPDNSKISSIEGQRQLPQADPSVIPPSAMRNVINKNVLRQVERTGQKPPFADAEWWKQQPPTRPELQQRYEQIFNRAQNLSPQNPVTVPQNGIPDGVARGADARHNIARQVLNGKTWEQASPLEQRVIDGLVAEGYGTAAPTLYQGKK